LQWLESVVFVGLALLCSLDCYWWMIRRVA
jgi:hypothetical protein